MLFSLQPASPVAIAPEQQAYSPEVPYYDTEEFDTDDYDTDTSTEVESPPSSPAVTFSSASEYEFVVQSKNSHAVDLHLDTSCVGGAQ